MSRQWRHRPPCTRRVRPTSDVSGNRRPIPPRLRANGHILDTTQSGFSDRGRLCLAARACIFGVFRNRVGVLGLLIEHTAHNRGVAGSSPALATNEKRPAKAGHFSLVPRADRETVLAWGPGCAVHRVAKQRGGGSSGESSPALAIAPQVFQRLGTLTSPQLVCAAIRHRTHSGASNSPMLRVNCQANGWRWGCSRSGCFRTHP
jgi:hypothetical protein